MAVNALAAQNVGVSLVRDIRDALPQSRPLPPDVWWRRHRAILVLLTGHAVFIGSYAVARGKSVPHAVFETSIIVVPTAFAALPFGTQRQRSVVAAVGLMACSAAIVHLSGGLTEMHFHFFAMVGVLSLYQEWPPILSAIGFVLLHHGVLGTVDPAGVYGNADAVAHPWKWAMVHGGFVIGASVANVFAWRMTQEAHDEAAAYRGALVEAELGRRTALELNDKVVQGLTATKLALELGQIEWAISATEATLAQARVLIAGMVEEGDGPVDVRPGELVLQQPAVVMTA